MNIIIIIISIAALVMALVMACIAFSRTFKNNRDRFSEKQGRKVFLDMGGHHGQSLANLHRLPKLPIEKTLMGGRNEIRTFL